MFEQTFKQRASGPDTIEYKIGEVFGEIKNMGNAGRNGGEYYTPRPLIRAMIKVLAPKIGERIYDGACGSAGFLCEAFYYLLPQATKADDLKTLQTRTFYGKEKKSLAYVIAIMNMILHGIEAPNVILDEAFEGIATAKANAEKNLHNARAVFESYLQDAYAVRVGHLRRERLEVLCERKRLITYGVIKLGDPTEGGVPCLRTSNVRWLRIDTTGMKRISPTLAAEYPRTILRGGEVLVNVRGTLGGVAVVPRHMSGWNVSREVAVVPINSDMLDPEYAAFWIGSRTSQDWLSGVKKGAAYTGINIEDLRNLPVPLPGLETQRAIVDDVLAIRDATRRMEEIYKDKVVALDELKKSLLHQAFTGALTVNAADKQLAAA